MSTPQLPAYKSHKTVRAAKINDINQSPANHIAEGGSWIILTAHGLSIVSHDFILKHKPEVGGYLVQYEDGYQSYSPAKAFEEGYTAVIQEAATDGGRNMRYEGKFEGETDAEQEQRLSAANGKTAPRVTPADIEVSISSEYYFTAADGVIGNAAPKQMKEGGKIEYAMVDYSIEAEPSLKLLTFCVLILRNGTKITGINYGAIDPAQHSAEMGRKEAREDAIRQVWPLLGYALREQLYQGAK